MDSDFLQSLLTDSIPQVYARFAAPLAPRPTLLILSLGGSDGWLRDEIRGDGPQPQRVQMVVCSDHREADRIFSQWCQLKQRKGLSIGGACSVWYQGPQTIAREQARYA